MSIRIRHGGKFDDDTHEAGFGRAQSVIRPMLFAMAICCAAVALVLASNVSSAQADDCIPADGDPVKIAAQYRSGAATLEVANMSGCSITSITGSTKLPNGLTAASPSTLHWGTGALAPQGKAMAQVLDGSGNLTGNDLTVYVNSRLDSSADKLAQVAGVRGNAGRAERHMHGGLAATGVPIVSLLVLALIGAAAGLCIGGSRSRNKDVAAMSRFMAILVALATVCAFTLSATPAIAEQSAATSVKDASGIVSTITADGKDYRLTSSVHIVYADGASAAPSLPYASHPGIAPVPQTSLAYAKAMGKGWNLGNSFDGYDTNPAAGANGGGETAWGNPVVTRALIDGIKAKGFTTIRMPLTLETRYSVNASAGASECKYVINPSWLKRYREVVDWAVDDGMYVMVNMHHDSWIWLNQWDGTESQDNEQYRKFIDFWQQLATEFANEPETVSFETINEPQFANSTDEQAIDKLTKLNKAAYDIIRSTDGNGKRMVVMPTLSTNDADVYTQALQKQISSLHDQRVMATVHYYGEWVYSANLGRTGFDEQLYDGQDTTPRIAADTLANHIKRNFTDQGIGTVIGEYGLLGYDTAGTYLQPGEELKYYEYMNHLADDGGFALLFWDNGSGVDRTRAGAHWKDPGVGAMIEASIHGRSAYATGLDTVYLHNEPMSPVSIPLTLNGTRFVGIDGLSAGKDYSYDQSQSVVTLSQSYLRRVYDAGGDDGQVADLLLRFSSGAPWHEYLQRSSNPTVKSGFADVVGTRSGGISLPIDFHGNTVRSVSALQGGEGAEHSVGPNSGWWKFLQSGGSYTADQDAGSLHVLKAFFDDASVKDGPLHLHMAFFDGSQLDIHLLVHGSDVSVDPSLNQ